MKTYKLFIAVLFACATTVAIGQRVKYRDLAPRLDTVSVSERMSLLKLYLLEEPEHGNANFRLAMLHYNVFRQSDPLLEYKKAMAHAKEAQLRLTKARIVVTSSDVKSDNEYYAPYFNTVDSKGKRIAEYGTVHQKMTIAYDSVQMFVEKMPAIYSAFTRSVKFYDKSVKLFAQLNTDFKTLEDIYMFFDDELNQRLEDLKISYDSSTFNFRLYEFLTQTYPLEKYKQKAHFKPIQVYRLDGLITRLNFLAADIEFWDYASWVDGVRKVYQDEIVGIKNRIAETETKLDESLKKLQAPGPQTDELQRISKDLVFQLNNYDRNSLALALLEYKSFKQNWLQKLQVVGRDTTIESQLNLYSQLIQLNRAADSLIHHIQSAATPGNTKKHSAYLTKYYGGDNGLQRFIKSEMDFIGGSFSQYQEILKENLVDYSSDDNNLNKFIKIGSLNIPLFVENKPLDRLDNISAQTLKIVKNPDGSTYLAGVHKANKKTNNNLTGFVARVNPDGKPAWIKDLNFAPDSLPSLDANNYVGDLVTTQEGCAVIVTSIRPTTAVSSNTFVFINDKAELKSYKLNDTAMARKLIYQESSNSFVMFFKGTEEKQQYMQQENISLTSINILGDLLWHQDVNLAGTLQDVVTVRDGYILLGNYTVMKDQSGKELRTRIAQQQSNPYMIKVNLQGQKTNVVGLSSPKSIYIDKVVKVNDGSINLLGYESTFDAMQDPTAVKGNMMHMMTAYDLKQICSNF